MKINKKSRLILRLTDKELERIKSRAKDAELTLSEYVRQKALGKRKTGIKKLKKVL